MTTLPNITTQKKTVLKTPQSLIHIKHNVSLRQYKYWVLLLRFYRDFYDAGELPDEKGFYRIPTEKLEEYLGYELVRSELKADFEALRKQPILINFLDKDGKKGQHGMGFISEWKITAKTIAFRIPSFLEDVMCGDDGSKQIFQLLNWNIFNSLSGKYEAIIYKLCKDYVGVKRTPYMTLDDYRDYIGLKKDDYAETRDFTKWCITNPLKSINKNELSDVDVSVEFHRVGRKIDGIHFVVTHRKQQILPFPEFEPNKAFALAKVSIPLEQQLQYLETMTEAEIQATIERANEYGDGLKQQGKKVHMGGIYKTAFSERWGVQKLEQKQADDAEKNKQIEAQKAERAKEQAKKQQEADGKAKTAEIVAWFDALPEDQKMEIMTDYIATVVEISRPTAERLYAKHGTNAHHESPQFKGLFMPFLRNKHRSIVDE